MMLSQLYQVLADTTDIRSVKNVADTRRNVRVSPFHLRKQNSLLHEGVQLLILSCGSSFRFRTVGVCECEIIRGGSLLSLHEFTALVCAGHHAPLAYGSHLPLILQLPAVTLRSFDFSIYSIGTSLDRFFPEGYPSVV